MRIQISHLNILGKLVEEFESMVTFGGITHKRLKSYKAISPGGRPSHTTPRYRKLPVNYVGVVPPAVDSFSAQLVACRDQTWWECQSHLSDSETCYDNDSASSKIHYDKTEYRKQSVSIREIRERMNSAQSTASTMHGPLEYEPGFKLLDCIQGGWKDMEMFID